MAISTRARKRVVLLLVTVVALSAAAAAGLQWRKSMRAQASTEARERGLEHYANGEWQLAMDELNKAHSYRDDPAVMVAMADSRRNVPRESGRHIPAAVAFAKQALTVDPDNTQAMDILLDLYVQMNQITELISLADERLAIDPEHHEALWSRARGLVSLGRSGDVEAIDALVSAHPDDVRGHYLRVQHMLSMGAGATEVRAYADEQAGLRPTSAEFLLLQAETRVRTSSPGDSLDDLRLDPQRAASLEMKDPQSLAKVVQLLDMLGQNEVADDLLNRELAKSGDAADDAVTIAIERDWKAGRIDQARERAVNSSADLDSASPAILGWGVLLAGEDQAQGTDHPAYGVLRLRAEDSARFWVHLIDGRSALSRGDWGVARTSLATAIQSPAARSGALAPLDIAEYLLGQAELALGAWREAAQRWERVASRNPSWVRVRLELAALMIENGLYRESFDHAGRVLASQPGNYDAGKAAARAMVFMLENGDAELDAADETIALMQELRVATEGYSDAELAQVLSLEARTRLVRGEDDLAQRAVDQLVSLGVKPPAADLLPLLAQADAAGLSGLDRLTAVGEGSSDVRTAAAVLQHEANRLASIGRSDEARELFEEAIEGAADEDRGEFERRFAMWLTDRGDEEGVRLLQALAENNPGSALAQIDLLNANAAWYDSDVVTPAIERLKNVGGESSVAWRVFQARELLTFGPTEARAAQAVELLGPGLRTTAPDSAALALAGEAMLVLGDSAAAADYFGRAVDADSRRVSIYPRLIMMLQGDGRVELARARQLEFVKIARVDGPLLMRRAEISEALGMWQHAVVDRRAIADAPGARLVDQARLGAALAKNGSVDEADAVFTKLKQSPIDDVMALSILAEYLDARERPEEAIAVIDASDVEPVSRERLAAALLNRQGKVGEAIERLEVVAEAEPSAEVYGDIARLRLQAGDAGAAMAAVEAGLLLSPGSADLAALEAAIGLRTGESGASEALAQLAQAAQGAELAPGLDEIIAATQKVSEDEDLPTYIRTLEDIADRFPASVLLSRLLATAHLQAGQAEKAIAVATDAARVFPGSAEAAQNAAEIFAQAGRLTEAETMARRWLNQTSTRPAEQIKAREAFARLVMERDGHGEAVAVLAPVEDRLIAEVAENSARFDIYARALAGAGRVDEARALFEGRLADGDVLWFRLFQSAAVALHRTPDAAREWLTEATAVAQEHPELLLQAAQAWFDLAGITTDPADFERAASVLEGIDGVERTAGVLLLAVCLEQLGRYEESEQRYRQALAVFPGEPIALNNLAYLMVKSGNPSEEAISLAEQALAAARERGYPASQIANFLQTLGTVLEALGHEEDAEERYREGLDLAQGDPNLLFSLSLLLADRGDLGEAVATFGRISPDLEEWGADAEFVEKYQSLKTRLSQADPSGP